MTILVRVKPGSKDATVVQDDATHYTVRVSERAVDGKANEAVIKMLAKHFDIAKTCVVILSGRASRTKRIEIQK